MRTALRSLPVVLALALSLILIPSTTAQTMHYSSTLSGAEEVPANASPATGEATYMVSADGLSMTYKITVTNLNNPVMAHIHLGAKGANGPVIVPLFNGTPGAGMKSGTLIEGTITADKLSGPMAGKTMADLLKEMEAGNTYTNVHTNDGKDPANSGVGDLSGGEIRGQIMPMGAAPAPGLPNTGGGYAAQTPFWLLGTLIVVATGAVFFTTRRLRQSR